jgi:poly-beta-1,6-N-acetyl-D-glucosamine synthase
MLEGGVSQGRYPYLHLAEGFFRRGQRRGPPFEVSVICCAYNESGNIGSMLRAVLQQNGPSFRIREVIVIASGCTDQTVEIASDIASRDPRVAVIVQPKREGKVVALELGLRRFSGDIALVENADTLPAPGAFEEVARCFVNPSIDVVCCHPIPVEDSRSISGTLARILWEVHHRVSLIVPKPGEAYAIRADSCPLLIGSEDDDVRIGALIRDNTVNSTYARDAIIYNRAPSRFKELLAQRIRIDGQVYRLRSSEGLFTPTWDLAVLVRAMAGQLKSHPRQIVHVVTLAGIETFARTWTRASALVTNHPNPTWHPLNSTKAEINRSDWPNDKPVENR